MLRRGQMEKEWLFAVESLQDQSYFEPYRSEPQKMVELCEMKNVPFNHADTQETAKLLYTKLKQDQDLAKQTENYTAPNPYEHIASPVIERMIFLLKLVPAFTHVKSPSVETANPFTMDDERLTSRSVSTDLAASVEPLPTPELVQHFLSKSTSIVPLTAAAIDKIERQKSDWNDSQAFSRRVGELRKWIHAYYGWKTWQDDSSVIVSQKHEAPPSSPLQGIVSFSENPAVSVKELERFIRVQIGRGKLRVEGLNDLHQVLRLCSFGSVRHQILGAIGKPISAGGHFLEGVTTCGYELTASIEHAFGLLFEELVRTLGSTAYDPTSRLLALGICGLAFRDSDATLLQKTRIFPILCDIFAEKEMNKNRRKNKKMRPWI